MKQQYLLKRPKKVFERNKASLFLLKTAEGCARKINQAKRDSLVQCNIIKRACTATTLLLQAKTFILIDYTTRYSLREIEINSPVLLM